MASNINPQNIDGAYPVAGQDNDSQGFRDNFTNTRTNFAFAAAEITDLQNKAVLKAALDGTVLNNDMGGSILSNAQLQDMSETRVALGTVSGAQTINYAAGPYYTLTTSGSVSIAFTNFPPAGQLGRVRLQITVASTAHTLTLPAAVTVNTLGLTGLDSPGSSVIYFPATGTYEYEFETNDGGSTITIISSLNNATNPFNVSGQILTAASSATITPGVTYTIFAPPSPSTSGTASLADGVNGVIKVITTLSTVDTFTVSVASAYWAGGAGTITFTGASSFQMVFLGNPGGGAWLPIGGISLGGTVVLS